MDYLFEVFHRGELIHSERVDGTKHAEEYVRAWIDNAFYGEANLAESDGVIPNGCADYRGEVRFHEYEDASDSFDFFLE